MPQTARFSHTHFRSFRASLLASTVAVGTAGAVLMWSPGALAAAGCTTTTPSIGQTIVCSTAGTETITIPTGADYATVIVIGSGGGSGYAESIDASGSGGNGASVSADLEVGSVAAFGVVVGAGGSGGASIAQGGNGGGYSAIELDSVTVAVAGGGGGGAAGVNLAGGSGGSGGSGAAAGTAAGGDGAVGPPNGNFAGGGGGNADGLGSAGAGGGGASAAGSSWAGGGAGGSVNFNLRGGGGAGYGGGGSGGDNSTGASGASGGGAGGSFADPTVASNIVYSPLGATAGSGDPGSGGAARIGGAGQTGASGSVTITFFIRATPNTDSSSPSARSILLNMSLPSDVQCDFRSIEASIGSWVQLPDADDCRSISSDQTTLLGWATDAGFPSATAQRQVGNGWGAYQTFNNDGDLTGVFIPAGGYTVLSNDTNLYPIWSE